MKTIKDYITEHMFSGKKVTVKSQEKYGYVDLDLPSGTLWATCNIGADKPEESGNYYAWGETEPKQEYEFETYKFVNRNSELEYSKYNSTDKLIVLEPIDDVATKTLGNKWCMPTHEDLTELFECTDKQNDTINGVNGQKFISKKDFSKWIFIPYCGRFDGHTLVKNHKGGFIWSSTMFHKNTPYLYSWCVYTDNYFNKIPYTPRYEGLPVRGVLKNNK